MDLVEEIRYIETQFAITHFGGAVEVGFNKVKRKI